MLQALFAVVLVVAQNAAAPAPAAGCSGPDPAIVSAAVKSVSTTGQLNHYTIAVTVTNAGSAAQSKDTLQFVDVYQGSVKLDAKGVPPLTPGQSYTVTYVSDRSVQAGNGTTKLHFAIDQTRAPGASNCNTGNDATDVTF